MKELKGKRLLILGGDRLSGEIVKKAKEIGVYTIVSDWYEEDRSPAKKISDKAFMTSTSDVKALLQLIEREKIDGVLTGFTDSALANYSAICEAAGLPCYGTSEQFNILTNKKIYKKLCRDFGVSVIDEYDINEVCGKEINYPVLVKPADNSGARGISICNCRQELMSGYIKALEFSKTKEVIVERYIDGKEVTIFYLLQNGEVYLTAMGNRHIKHNQQDVIALPVAYTFPSVHLEKYQKIGDPKVKDMFRSIGIENGMVFMQCLIEDGECVVYDIGYRLTGSMEYKLLEAVCDFNPLEMMIRFALTGQMADYSLEEKASPKWERYACNISFLVKPGVVDKIHGIDKIMEIPGVIDAVLAHAEGDEIKESAKGTLQQIILRVFATASTQEQLEEILNEVYQSLKVVSFDGSDMLLDGFCTEELKEALI